MTTPEPQYIVGLTFDQAKVLMAIIDVAAKRGAFHATDFGHVHTIYDHVAKHVQTYVTANPSVATETSAAQPRPSFQRSPPTMSFPSANLMGSGSLSSLPPRVEKKPQTPTFLGSVE